MKGRKLTALPKYILTQIERIVSGIEKGKLAHIQYDYGTRISCGTAHCIAGWHDTFKYMKATQIKDPTNVKTNEMEDFFQLNNDLPEVIKESHHILWAIAAKDWQLTVIEQNLLFGGARTLNNIRGTLEQLKKGLRATGHLNTVSVNWIDPAKNPTNYRFDQMSTWVDYEVV